MEGNYYIENSVYILSIAYALKVGLRKSSEVIFLRSLCWPKITYTKSNDSLSSLNIIIYKLILLLFTFEDQAQLNQLVGYSSCPNQERQ